MIKTHKELAEKIVGKSILHMNSLGKDSVACLEWLTSYAQPARVVSVFFKFLASYPGDDKYLNYLKKRYPTVEFVSAPNAIELSLIRAGVYQTPIFTLKDNSYEFYDFDRGQQIAELKAKYGCDYICDGSSKYESFARRTKFHQKGLLFKDVIYPLGMMSKAQVISVIKNSGMKLHPSYKFAPSTFDHPSYWKMRSAIIGRPDFKKRLLETYPLFILDMYRYERLLK